MGSFQDLKRTQSSGGKPGKIVPPLNEKLNKVKWGEFKIVDIFDVKNTKNILSRDIVENSGVTPYLCASSENNGVSSYISYDEKYLDKGNCVFIGGKTFVVSYQENDFYSNDSHNLVLYLKNGEKRDRAHQLFLAACINRSLGYKYSWGDSISNRKIQTDKVLLPIKNGEIDFDFMETYIAEIEAERTAEMEAYLYSIGSDEYTLTSEEQSALDNYEKLEWQTFNLEKLFGKSTRGKRLKSADRISGTLPFVTAGEANQGISAFIGNDVHIFSSNTTTIDMFGSAKYRNYKFGGDDHIAVVHTEKLQKFASIFVTAAIHKSSYNGQFHYGRNFYAKDADELNISLPVKQQKPDYETMTSLISAIQKLVIKDVVLFVERKRTKDE